MDRHDHAGAPTQASDWDERYRHDSHGPARDAPNEVLVAELGGTAPGRALEIGCADGTDAIWLAAKGWQVTATDISQVALDHARARAHEQGVTVEWVCGAFEDSRSEPAAFDLVVTLYPALRHGPDDADVAARLGDGWLIAVDETRARFSAPSDGPPHALDTVLKAYRLE